MGKVIILNLILAFRVLLVGGFLLILPRVTRKGLLLGVYVGEACAEGDEARRLLRRWNRGCLLVMAVSFATGLLISLVGWPVTGNLTGTAVLLLLALGLYLHMYRKARGLAPPAASRQADRAVAVLDGGEPEGALMAKVALGVGVAVSLATIAYAIVSYEAMPARVSVLSVMFLPSVNLLISPFLALLALLTTTAKRSVREGAAVRSVEAQDAFRAAVARLLGVSALLSCGFLTLLSVQMIRILLGEIRSPGVAVFVFAGIVVLYMFAGMVRILKRYGQGGALIEAGSANGPLSGGLADNAHWLWGLFYVDRQDPSIMVEKRFGLGYTLNYGNRTAVLIVGTFFGLALSLLALVLVMAMR